MGEEPVRGSGLPASDDAPASSARNQDPYGPIFVHSGADRPFRNVNYVASGMFPGELLRPEANVFLGDLAVEGLAPVKVASSWDAGETLQKIRAVYVQPPPYDAAQYLLRRERLVVLSGYRHWGRRTSALHLLANDADADAVLEIDPAAELSAIDFQPHAGYLIDNLWSETASRLSRPLLQRLTAELRKQATCLVVTVDRSVPLPEAAMPYVVDWAHTPDVFMTLRRHLAWYAGGDEEVWRRAEELTNAEPVQGLIHVHLLPYEIDELARLLVEVAQGRLDIEEALARSEASALEEAARWFAVHPDPGNWAFMLSLAVLNGAPYRLVADAAESLERRLKPASSEGTTEQSMSAAARTSRLVDSGAHVVSDHRQTAFGLVPVERVEFSRPSSQRAVLDHVWHEYDLQRPMLDWLRELGTHADDEVRVRAAAAVGALSRDEFGYVYERVLLVWAADEDDNARHAAAVALGVAASDRQLASAVLALLHQWCALDASVLLRRTAAAAYGIVGMFFPEAALHDLGLLMRAEDGSLLEVVGQSLGSLLEADVHERVYTPRILDALERWTKDANPAVSQNGSYLFLTLAARNAAAREDADTIAGPALLIVASAGGLYAASITRLWRAALNIRHTRTEALERLQDWMHWADKSSPLTSGLDAIITALADDQGQERILLHVRRWANDPTGGSPSARRLLSTVKPAPDATPSAAHERPPITIFISYKDERLRNQLVAHLSPMKRRGLIHTWHDRMIGPGEDWRRAIDRNLERAAIVLLLVSADFLASDYCYEKEFAFALTRHAVGKAQVVPVLARDASWEETPIGRLQAIPYNGRPVTRWSNRDAAWKNVVEGVYEVIARLR
jgi:TIR domain